MLDLNLLVTFLEEFPAVSSQYIRCDFANQDCSSVFLTIFCPNPGHLHWHLQFLWKHHILPHQHKVPAHPCPQKYPLKSKSITKGFSLTCSAEVSFSFAISSQEPFTLPMSAQVLIDPTSMIKFQFPPSYGWTAELSCSEAVCSTFWAFGRLSQLMCVAFLSSSFNLVSLLRAVAG